MYFILAWEVFAIMQITKGSVRYSQTDSEQCQLKWRCIKKQVSLLEFCCHLVYLLTLEVLVGVLVNLVHLRHSWINFLIYHVEWS